MALSAGVPVPLGSVGTVGSHPLSISWAMGAVFYTEETRSDE